MMRRRSAPDSPACGALEYVCVVGGTGEALERLCAAGVRAERTCPSYFPVGIYPLGKLSLVAQPQGLEILHVQDLRPFFLPPGFDLVHVAIDAAPLRHRRHTTKPHHCAPLPQSPRVEGCPALNGFARRSTMLSLCRAAMVSNAPRCRCACRAHGDPKMLSPTCRRLHSRHVDDTSTSRSRLAGPNSTLEVTLLFRVPLSHSKTSTPCMSSTGRRHDHLPAPLPCREKERATPAPRLGARCQCAGYGVHGCRQGGARGRGAPTFLAYI
jgi:hypothetical protein